ncbi:MAG: nuclear transport factor 2 family protein [Actinomycetota bacterium]|nr:nuclear transport factor 2 family protein [Actinomycetota bacterium]MDA2970544.1 nuclear transport factor 2 family protein [Actinomycetota bacterium]MDA3001656.1 nuclear transport factor 2 family protein [Actinomycetota bacterium]
MTPLETVNAFIRALEANDLDTACSMVDDKCEYDNVPMIKVFGPEGVRGILAPMFADCTEIEWVIHREAMSGSTVFNERLDRFKMSHGWVELPVNGVWEVQDGKITLWRDYFDAASYLKQMPKA